MISFSFFLVQSGNSSFALFALLALFAGFFFRGCPLDESSSELSGLDFRFRSGFSEYDKNELHEGVKRGKTSEPAVALLSCFQSAAVRFRLRMNSSSSSSMLCSVAIGLGCDTTTGETPGDEGGGTVVSIVGAGARGRGRGRGLGRDDIAVNSQSKSVGTG